MTPVFVFGTLKAGFPNHHHNDGRLLGRFVTRERFPLYLAGERCSPWLLDMPGTGERVAGEVYLVDDPALARMDRLERTHAPDGYRRREIMVEGTEDEVLEVQVYLKPPAQFDPALFRGGPYAEYTAEHAALYRQRAGVEP